MSDIVQVEPYAKAAVDAVIPAGNTISEAFDCEGCNLVALLIPDDWDGGTTINFQSAAENKLDTVFKPVHGATGTAIGLTSVAAGRVVSVSAVIELRGLRYFKLVAASGVAAKRTVRAIRVQGGVGQ